jgi:hypothetical protein
MARATELPPRIKLLSWGVNETTEGPITVNERSLEAFADMQRKTGRERVALDFEHNTVPGTPEYERTQEPRAVAAYGTPLIIQGEGLFLDGLTYTEIGEANAANYEDVSAAPFTNDGLVLGLHSAALTRTGAAFGQHFKPAKFSASMCGAVVLSSCVPFVGPKLRGLARALAAHQREIDASTVALRAAAVATTSTAPKLTGLAKAMHAHMTEASSGKRTTERIRTEEAAASITKVAELQTLRAGAQLEGGLRGVAKSIFAHFAELGKPITAEHATRIAGARPVR